MLGIIDEIHDSVNFCRKIIVNIRSLFRVTLTTISFFSMQVFIFFFSSNSFGQSLKLSEVKGSLEHPSLELAMQQKMDTIYIDKIEGNWVFGPCTFKEIADKVIIFEEGVEINAKQGVFEKGDALFEFVDCQNIEIIGKNNIVCMNKEEYVSGEWRHIFSFRGCDNIKISNLILRDSGGDGIYIAGSKLRSYSSNIYVVNIESSNNKRQGISIISAKKVSIINSNFKNTKGTLPGCGLDIEPNSTRDFIHDISVKNCRFENNFGPGVSIGLGKLGREKNHINIIFDNCFFSGNHSTNNENIKTQLLIGVNPKFSTNGLIVFKNSYFEKFNSSILYSRKVSKSLTVRLESCTIENSMNLNSPLIYLEVPSYDSDLGALGGFVFNNVYVTKALNKTSFLCIRGSKKGTLKKVEDIKGRIILTGSKNYNQERIQYINYLPNFNRNFHLDFIDSYN